MNVTEPNASLLRASVKFRLGSTVAIITINKHLENGLTEAIALNIY